MWAGSHLELGAPESTHRGQLWCFIKQALRGVRTNRLSLDLGTWTVALLRPVSRRSQTQGHALCHSTDAETPTGSGDGSAEGRGGGGDGACQRTRSVRDLNLGGTLVKFQQSGTNVYALYVHFNK